MKKKKIVKDSYIVRTKKRILKDTAESEKKYTTNFKDIRNYFKIFNKSLFKSKLNPFNDVMIKRIIGGSGQCVEYISYRKGTNRFVLEMMPKYKNKMEFLNTLSQKWYIYGNKL